MTGRDPKPDRMMMLTALSDARIITDIAKALCDSHISGSEAGDLACMVQWLCQHQDTVLDTVERGMG